MKIWCDDCNGRGYIPVPGRCSAEYKECPTCAGFAYTLQNCSNCRHQDGKIGGTAIDVKDGVIVETDATQYHCAHHEQYLPAGITCKEWRVKS